MPAATSPFAPVAQSDDVPSTSCTEDETHHLLREPPARSRSVWKVAAVATVTGLIAAAGTWYTNGKTATAGQKTAGLDDVKYAAYDTIGCSNWKDIEIFRTTTVNRGACAMACDADPTCTTFNWQATACEPGWYKNNGCLLFKDSCSTERNKCWELNYKIEEDTSTSGPDVGSTTA